MLDEAWICRGIVVASVIGWFIRALSMVAENVVPPIVSRMRASSKQKFRFLDLFQGLGLAMSVDFTSQA